MVGRSEGTAGDQGVSAVRKAADRPQLGGLQRLLAGQVGQDGGQAFGQHTLACAGRAYHEDVMSAGGGDLQGAFGLLLALHVSEVGQVV